MLVQTRGFASALKIISRLCYGIFASANVNTKPYSSVSTAKIIRVIITFVLKIPQYQETETKIISSFSSLLFYHLYLSLSRHRSLDI